MISPCLIERNWLVPQSRGSSYGVGTVGAIRRRLPLPFSQSPERRYEGRSGGRFGINLKDTETASEGRGVVSVAVQLIVFKYLAPSGMCLYLVGGVGVGLMHGLAWPRSAAPHTLHTVTHINTATPPPSPLRCSSLSPSPSFLSEFQYLRVSSGNRVETNSLDPFHIPFHFISLFLLGTVFVSLLRCVFYFIFLH